jgi:hypothetical protein
MRRLPSVKGNAELADWVTVLIPDLDTSKIKLPDTGFYLRTIADDYPNELIGMEQFSRCRLHH